jgi:hypothetical protein
MDDPRFAELAAEAAQRLERAISRLTESAASTQA